MLLPLLHEILLMVLVLLLLLYWYQASSTSGMIKRHLLKQPLLARSPALLQPHALHLALQCRQFPHHFMQLD